MIITPVLAILVFIIIFIIALVATWLIDPEKYNVSRWYVFIGSLAGMSIVITFLFYYSVIELQQQQQELIAIQETRNVNASIIDSSVNEIQKSSPIIPYFTMTLFPLTIDRCEISKKEPEVSNQQLIQKTSLSYKLFNSWETMILSKNYISSKRLSYIIYFLQWASSQELKKMWNNMYLNFTENTQKFGFLLFKYAATVKHATPMCYANTAKKLLRELCNKKILL